MGGVYRKSQYVVIVVTVLCIWARFILFPAAFLVASHTIYTLNGCYKSIHLLQVYQFFPISLFLFLPPLSHHQNTKSLILSIL